MAVSQGIEGEKNKEARCQTEGLPGWRPELLWEDDRMGRVAHCQRMRRTQETVDLEVALRSAELRLTKPSPVFGNDMVRDYGPQKLGRDVSCAAEQMSCGLRLS